MIVMETVLKQQEFQVQAKMKTELVKQGLVQYLTLSTKGPAIDQEELEWPLLIVAQEIQQSLNLKGVKWDVPQFQRIIAQANSDSALDYACKLLIRLPDSITWNEYDRAIKKTLELRRDFWVVQIRFERMVEGWCLKYTHRGARSEIPALVAEMKAVARAENLQIGNYNHELFISDVEKVAASQVETSILIPVEK